MSTAARVYPAGVSINSSNCVTRTWTTTFISWFLRADCISSTIACGMSCKHPRIRSFGAKKLGGMEMDCRSPAPSVDF